MSTSGEHVEKASRLEHWQSLLNKKAIDATLLSIDTLTRDALMAAAERVTNATINDLTQSGKYLREATIERQCLAETLSSFEAGQRTGLVVGGPSGIGKSSFLARCVERWNTSGHVVVFYRSSALSRPDISTRLLRDLGVSNSMSYLEEFLSAANPAFSGTGHRFLVVVDAVNEFPGDVTALVQELDAMVHQAQQHPWFRIVASVRDGTERRLPIDARFGARGLGPYVTVEEVVDGETRSVPVVRLQPVTEVEVEALYEAYRNYRIVDPEDPDDPGVALFCPLTPYTDLDPKGQTRTLLREPLLARLVLAAHHRRPLPGNLRVDAAMKLYLETAVVEAGSRGGGFPERLRFLQGFVKAIDQADMDSIARDTLIEDSGLRPLFGSFQRDSPYLQLLDLGVLLEEWRDDECHVRFAFDRMLEFLLAERLDPRVHTTADVLGLAERAVHFAPLRGVIGIVLGRACDDVRAELVTDLLDATDESGISTAVSELVVATITELVVRLGVDDSPGFSHLLLALQETPSVADVAMLCTAADELARLGAVSALESVLHALDSESRVLAEPSSRAKAALRLSARAGVVGELGRQEAFIREAVELACDDAIRAEAMRQLADLLHLRGEIIEAQTIAGDALELSDTIADRRGVSASNKQLGVFAKFRGNYLEAERFFGIALTIDGELSDNQQLCEIYDQLAMIALLRGNYDDADRLLNSAIELATELGKKLKVGHYLDHLASLRLTQGDPDEAERLYRSSLEIQEYVGNTLGVGNVYGNLGCLEMNRD